VANKYSILQASSNNICLSYRLMDMMDPRWTIVSLKV
jgi:hypothetical protein